MRIYSPGWSHASVGRWLREEARKGFQKGVDPHSVEYVERCTCGVNLPEGTNSVSLIFTRDADPDCLIGWHLSFCAVTSSGYRTADEGEPEYWVGVLYGKYARLAAPWDQRGPLGVAKDVRHFILPVRSWDDKDSPVARLEGLDGL